MLRAGHLIALCVFALLTIGVVMVNSAGMKVHLVGPDGVQDPGISAQTIIFSRTTAYMALALAAMLVGSLTPVRQLASRFVGEGSRKTLPVLAGGAFFLVVLCALVYVPGLKRHVNGSSRWIEIPGIGEGLSMQPSELAKWGMVALMAWYGASRARLMDRFWAGLVPALVAVGLVAGFVALADLGTGVLIAVAACFVLLAAGARIRYFLLFVPVGILGFIAAVKANPYRIARITSFLDPYQDPEKTGYHMIQSLIAIANGEIWGRGLGHGLQKFDYLPEDKTDFIFAVICEELGIAGAAVVISLFLALIWCCHGVAKRERDPLLRLFTLGVMATVGLQAAINLAVVTGLAPTKGIALPMLSSGGTGWILTAFSLGLLVSIDRTQERESEEVGVAVAA
jgi:cell division protein FtsW